jgi:hypothetical protein
MSEWKHAKDYSITDAKYDFLLREDTRYAFKTMKERNVDTLGDMMKNMTFIPDEVADWVDKYGIQVVMNVYQDWLLAQECDHA